MPSDLRVGVEPRPGVAKPDAMLAVDGVRKAFGGLRAVDVDHLEVQRGAITALIGPNGAGKTTLFNVLTGFDHPTSGDWEFDGVEISGWPAHRVAQAGMVRTFQLTKALSKMSVLDNMLVGASGQRGERILTSVLPWAWRAQEQELVERADSLLGRFGLAARRNDYAGTLSGGQRKLLEMARALMAEPKMLLLDEPTAGVNPALVESILERILQVSAEGLTLLFVEHDMDVVMSISDWVVCMAEGSVISEGPPAHVAADDQVIDAYLGTRRGAPGS
jgi:branched-chain amino acid transport system ATP-binding protein